MSRNVPEIGEHLDTSALELGRLRVLVLVDQVLVDTQIHQAMDLRLLPRLAERSQVLAGVSVEEQLVRNRLVRQFGPHLTVGKESRGQAFQNFAIGVERIEQIRFLLVQGHGGPSVRWSQVP